MGAHQILLLIALACFGFAAFLSYREEPRGGSLIAAGLFFLTLAALV